VTDLSKSDIGLIDEVAGIDDIVCCHGKSLGQIIFTRKVTIGLKKPAPSAARVKIKNDLQ
jgi:hypothetical protein